MATLQANQIDVVGQGMQPQDATDSSSRSYLDRIRDRFARLPESRSFLTLRISSPGQSSLASVTRTSTTTTATTDSEFRESTSTVATSVLSPPPSFFFQGYYISPGATINDEIQAIWTQKIKSRLRASLPREISVGTCVQEFMMAGKRPEATRPAIVVSCGDAATRKRVVNIFQGQVWLQELLKENGLMFIFVVAKVWLSMSRTVDALCTSSLKVTAEDDLDSGFSATLISLEDAQEDDQVRTKLRSPTPKQRPESMSNLSVHNISNTLHTSNLRRNCETISITSHHALATMAITSITSIGRNPLKRSPHTVGPSYTTFTTIITSSLTAATLTPTSNKPQSSRSIIVPILGSTLGIVTVVALILLTLFFIRRKHRYKNPAPFEDEENTSEAMNKSKSQLRSERLMEEEMIFKEVNTLAEEPRVNEVHELESNYVYELAADETVEPKIMTLKDEIANAWPLPISPLPLLFKLAETQDERVEQTSDNKISTRTEPQSHIVGERFTSSTLMIPEACCVLRLSLKSSACGLHLPLNTPEPRTQRHCTLGGLIMVNGAVFGLTAGNPFKDHLEFCSAGDTPDLDSSKLDVGTLDHEPFVFNSDDSFSTTLAFLRNEFSFVIEFGDYPEAEHIVLVDPKTRESPLYGVVIPVTTLSPTPESTPEYFDWAVLEELPYSFTKLPNKVMRTDSKEDVYIERIITPPPQGEATILIARKEAQVGHLHSSPVTMRVDEFVLEVYVLTLDQTLPLGCSGAWVVFEGQLCGIIVAIREDIPWAYMAPIEPILRDIRTKLGTHYIRLPRRGEVESLSKDCLARSLSPVKPRAAQE